ncbi:MAG: hypothetical protein IPH77_11920 [Ignavibacteria bacterium]|nr:hypothetical protein [Ignavibacteria bacterium]
MISHRGPDDEGYAVFNTYNNKSEERYGDTSAIKKGSHILSDSPESFNLAFGFRRLSILDLSVNGHQPFFNREKNICMIFNGEVYNYIEIRKNLFQKVTASTGTDTEVIMNAYIEWGEDCLSRFNGMWGIALYDFRKIFYSAHATDSELSRFIISKMKRFVFASELKSIIEYFKSDPSFRKELNKENVYDYFVYNFADHSENTL